MYKIIELLWLLKNTSIISGSLKPKLYSKCVIFPHKAVILVIKLMVLSEKKWGWEEILSLSTITWKEDVPSCMSVSSPKWQLIGQEEYGLKLH